MKESRVGEFKVRVGLRAVIRSTSRLTPNRPKRTALAASQWG